jgi:hypothetical protein
MTLPWLRGVFHGFIQGTAPVSISLMMLLVALS